jgi:hypothetical protein
MLVVAIISYCTVDAHHDSNLERPSPGSEYIDTREPVPRNHNLKGEKIMWFGQAMILASIDRHRTIKLQGLKTMLKVKLSKQYVEDGYVPSVKDRKKLIQEPRKSGCGSDMGLILLERG